MILEKFTASNLSPSLGSDDKTITDSIYYNMLDELEKYIQEGNTEKIKELDLQIRTFLQQKLSGIEEKRKLLEKQEKNKYQPENIIDDTDYQKRLEEKKYMLSKKITFRRKYENIKSRELIDKKQIVALYLVNGFLLFVIVIGCILVFQQKNISLNGLSKLLKKTKNRRNNNKNNNRNISNNSNSLNGL